MAEIETDKATMEFEAVDEGVIAKILVSEGTDNVKVGTVIAILAEEGEDASSVQAPTKSETPAPAKPMPTDPTDPNKTGSEAKPAERTLTQAEDHGKPVDSGKQGGSSAGNGRAIASPLARRVASQKGLDLSALTGSGPNGRIVKADVERWRPSPAPVVVADPARKGLGKRAVKTLLRADPSVLVLVSCDPSSFGRDAALLLNAGLHVDRWTVLDMFPGTSHVETVARFTR